MISRLLSIVLAVVYLVSAYSSAGGKAAFQVGRFLILPLACIWFGEAMGDFTGVSIQRTTPGCFVVLGGWLLLLLPVFVVLLN